MAKRKKGLAKELSEYMDDLIKDMGITKDPKTGIVRGKKYKK